MGEGLQTVPLWKIWANPIFQRYARSRLRVGTLLPWVAVVLIAAAFAFFVVYLNDLRLGRSRAVAAADAFFPVVVIQMVILLLIGTGSVASGITSEADDGMTDYQRLTPMTPLAKIAGYLFGLPVREYVLFACTLPFTVFSVAAGGLPLWLVTEIYFVLFMSAILYHLTGCVAGTVVKRRRFASRLAQMLVVLLYFVLPGLSRIGFVFFEYLTMRPVLLENLSGVHLPAYDRMFGDGPLLRSVYLFDFEFSQLGFSVLIQSSLIVTFVVILYRKWRQQTNHLLGKNFAVALYLWVMLLLIGNALPLISDGSIFPSQGDMFHHPLEQMHKHDRQAEAIEAYVLSGVFGAGTIFLAFAFISSITPTSDEHTKGLRRARKLGGGRIPLRADGATATWHTLAIGLIGVLSWSHFIDSIFNSEHVQPVAHNTDLLRAVPLTLLLYLLCYHGILERFGRRNLLLYTLFFWIVPLLGSIIMVAAGIEGLPVLVAALSAFAAPFYTLVLPLQDDVLLGDTGQLMQGGILFALFAHLVLLAFISWSLRRHKRRIRRQVESE